METRRVSEGTAEIALSANHTCRTTRTPPLLNASGYHANKNALRHRGNGQSRASAAECRLSRRRWRRLIALSHSLPEVATSGWANDRRRSSIAIEFPAVSAHCIAPIRAAAVSLSQIATSHCRSLSNSNTQFADADEACIAQLAPAADQAVARCPRALVVQRRNAGGCLARGVVRGSNPQQPDYGSGALSN